MTLHYRVVVFRTEDAQYKAYVRAFPSLSVRGGTPEKTIDAARREIVRILSEYAREGRRPPAPDREAIVTELVAVSFENKAPYRSNIQIDVTAGKVLEDGAEISVRGATLELLVMLATEPRDVSIEALCVRMYAGVAFDQAYAALKMCVYRARKQLGGSGIIETTEHGYRLAEDVIVDTRFLAQIVRSVRTRSVAKAIEIRLDTIFADLLAGRPAAYEAWEWFVPVERTLKGATREIGLYLAESALRAGDSERALDFALRLAALDPLDETVHELAIRVHLARGDRASALRTFRRYANDLQAKHGIEPSPALRALVEAGPS